MKKEKCQNQVSLTNACSLFVYAIRSQLTRDYYLRRLRTLFDFIKLLPNSKIEQRCNHFAATGIKDPDWTFGKIIGFLQFQKERVESNPVDLNALSYSSVIALAAFRSTLTFTASSFCSILILFYSLGMCRFFT
jgi:hypothetical protein